MERHILFMNWNNQHSKGLYYMMCLLRKKSLNDIILQQKMTLRTLNMKKKKRTDESIIYKITQKVKYLKYSNSKKRKLRERNFF